MGISQKMSFEEFKEEISSYSSLAELYFKLINFLCFICYDLNVYYCFCDRCDSVKLNYNLGRRGCTLCRIQTEFGNFEEMLGKNQYKEGFSKKYLNNLIPYLIEYYAVDKRSIECLFLGKY